MNNKLFGISVILILILGAVKLTEIKSETKKVVDPWYAFTKFMKGYLISLAL